MTRLKKLFKVLIIILCFFIIASVLITYLLILNTNKEKVEETYNEKEQIIDLYGTYDQNDLLINDFIEVYNDVEVKLPKIEGLKDINIQDKINQDMYNRAYEILTEYSNINYGDYYSYANFANVISIRFCIGIKNGYEDVHFNYNLINGEPLKLEDLFIKNTDITGIIRSAFYETLSSNNQFNAEENIVSPDENELYKVVKAYINDEDKKFSFSPAEICFYYNDYMASVKMTDIYDRVSIYSKYLTDESIYTRDDLGFKNIFTCATSSYEAFEKIEYGYLEDNFWYDISVFKDYISEEIDEDRIKKFNEFKNIIYNEVYEKVNEYREKAKNNKDKFYILFSKPSVYMYSKSNYENGKWNYTYSNMATINKNIQIFEMPISIYENVYKDKLIDTYRYEYFTMRGGAYLDTEAKDGATITVLDDRKSYNYITGEEIKEVTDIFKEESNYIEVIKAEVKESLLEKYDYIEEEAEKLLENINYELGGDQVNVTIPGLDNFIEIIYFNEFDTKMMKIF